MVATLEGEVELEFDPGTQPGEVRVLRGRGMPVLQGFGRGDHRVLVNVTVPHQITEEQRHPARRLRAPVDREDLSLRRGLLREAEERFPLSLVRASVVVPRDRVEEATARMLDLFPEGFAEQPAGEAVELVAFTDEAGAGRLRESFGEIASSPVARRLGRGVEALSRPGRRRVALDRPALGDAARGADRRRHRSRTGVRDRRASDDPALPRVPGGTRAGKRARRRLRIRRARDRSSQARLRAGRARSTRTRPPSRRPRGTPRRTCSSWTFATSTPSPGRYPTRRSCSRTSICRPSQPSLRRPAAGSL